MDDDFDELIDIFLVFGFISMAVLLFVGFFSGDPDQPQGTIVDMVHTPATISQEFTVGQEEEVVSEETFMLSIDVDGDGESDEDYEVDGDEYAHYDKGDTYPSKESS